MKTYNSYFVKEDGQGEGEIPVSWHCMKHRQFKPTSSLKCLTIPGVKKINLTFCVTWKAACYFKLHLEGSYPVSNGIFVLRDVVEMEFG
jgi:hypothetical protein